MHEIEIEKYLIENPNGVFLKELEDALNISRLRLGYVINKLINEGKIVKIKNLYYLKIN